MMTNPANALNQELLEVLQQLPLSDARRELAEAYLSGEKGEEVLSQMEFQDLSAIPSDKALKMFRALNKKGKTETVSRWYQLLFAIGQETSYQLLYMAVDSLPAFLPDAEKRAAVFAMYVGTNKYAIAGGAIKNLINLAKGKPENLRKALDYNKGKFINGKLILLASYFLTKYGSRGEEAIPVEQEDAALMQQYEKVILSNLDTLFENQLDKASLQAITDAIVHDRITEQTLQLAGTVNASEFWLKLLGGMAYLNFPLSVRLKNFVRICLAAHRYVKPHATENDMLNAIESVSEGLSMDIRQCGGDFDKVFQLDTEAYICWAADQTCMSILEKQFHHNRECYLKTMDKAELKAFNLMFEVVKRQDPALYEKLFEQRRQQRHNQDMEKLISMPMFGGKDAAHADIIKGYLRGEKPVDTLYPIVDQLGSIPYGGSWETTLCDEYKRTYPEDAFLRRCQVFLLLSGKYYYLTLDIRDIHDQLAVHKEKAAALFKSLDMEGLSIARQLSGFVGLYDYSRYYVWKNDFFDSAADCFTDYLKDRREETLNAFSSAEAVGRFFGLRVMRKAAGENKKEILAFSQDSAKAVKEELFDILCGQKDWEEDVKNFLNSKKAAERELAVKVLLHWQGGGDAYHALFAQALEKEKNSKVRTLLENALNLEKEGAAGEALLSTEDLIKEIHKGGKKRALAWAYETPFSAVHRKNGEAAGEDYLQAVLLCYSHVDGCGVSKKAAALAEHLQTEEFAVYVNELFDKWMETGAEAKKRWVLYAASIHGGPDIIKKLQNQIQEWPKNARGAIAAEAVQALSLNPLPQALLIVDGIARKFKFKQIKAAAGKALDFAAEQLGISREQLADRIVPDLGFDENMERRFDYGKRSFKVMITPALEIEVYDENGKKLKNMPAPGKKDDEKKAAAAYEEFKQMKKQMKAAVSSQKERLELVLATAREWSVEAWKQLFVKNPLMHQFAIGLIWGIYEGGKLVQSFRYMEDGTFNTEDEEEYALPETGQIGLVHPVELSEESRGTWKQQLEDYEISQPIEQLAREVYVMTEKEAGMQKLERFDGRVINDLSLGGKLQRLGWYRGSVQDAGCFDTYYREDEEVGLGVELHFSGSFIGGENEDVTVQDARFYKAGTIERGSYLYDEAGEEKAYFLRDVPARYFSEIVWQLTKATAAGA